MQLKIDATTALLDKTSSVLLALFFLLFSWIAFRKPPWHDEIFTFYVSQQSYPQILHTLKQDSSAPLYYFAVRAWRLLLGPAILSIRILSILLTLTSGVVLISIASQLQLKLGKPFLLTIFLLHPYNFYYSVEARTYALLILLILLLIRQLTVKKNPFALTVILILLLYTHTLSLFLVPVVILISFLTRKPRFSLLVLSALIFYLPFLPTLLSQPKASLAWMQVPLKMSDALLFFGYLFPQPPPEFTYPFIKLPYAVPIFGIINLGLILYACASRQATSRGFWRLSAISVMVIFTSLFALSLLFYRSYFPSRGELLALPFFLITILYYISRLTSKIRIAIFLLAVAVMGVLDGIWVLNLRKWTSYEQVAAAIKTHIKDEDRLFVPGPWYLSLRYNLEKQGVFPEFMIVPRDQASHPGWYDCRSLKTKEIHAIRAMVSPSSSKKNYVFWLPSQPCAQQFQQEFGGDIIKIFRYGPAVFGEIKTKY